MQASHAVIQPPRGCRRARIGVGQDACDRGVLQCWGFVLGYDFFLILPLRIAAGVSWLFTWWMCERCGRIARGFPVELSAQIVQTGA